MSTSYIQIYAEVLLDEEDREEIEVDGEQGQPVVLNFESHQHLAKYDKIVVSFENFGAIYVSFLNFCHECA